MKFWNQFLIWIGVSFVEQNSKDEGPKFEVNRRYDPKLWKKNKMK